jgi:hypothetical protein
MSDKRLIQMIDVQDTKITDLQKCLQENQDIVKLEICRLNRDGILNETGQTIQYQLRTKLQQCEDCCAYSHYDRIDYCSINKECDGFKQCSLKEYNVEVIKK